MHRSQTAAAKRGALVRTESLNSQRSPLKERSPGATKLDVEDRGIELGREDRPHEFKTWYPVQSEVFETYLQTYGASHLPVTSPPIELLEAIPVELPKPLSKALNPSPDFG